MCSRLLTSVKPMRDPMVRSHSSFKLLPLEVLNNGHTVQLNIGNGSRMVNRGQTLELSQVHFHTPNKQVVNGNRFPMEAHLVHKRTDGALGLIGVFFEKKAEN